ncbi:SMP-30/gluconolactonase/LRE family protein [Echinicola strongylocentroti]|uniref:SMP-30/gluconolactonase/LRE family protein n=1 Tax=Echinicola strongylocentroti TaxID=1795355 RepID=A0A2Z4IEX9_9BACT|nr:SMP-30/gluconolactonase/LRE family protein [Echinicola strongylocentroti]AWW29038.1 SMP-30/gluconolactonase/LRE family protein [Echinicola strongylocentroti]
MNIKPILMGSLLGAAMACSTNKTSKNIQHQPTTASTSPFSINILDDQALKVISPDAKIERMASGFDWVEGPLWVEEGGGYLLFSDIPQNKIYKMTIEGDTSTYLFPSGYTGNGTKRKEPGSNGLLLSNEGELVLMQHGDRRVAKMKAGLNAPSSEYSSLADSYKGKRFNSPNDGVFDQEGNLYFTDPPYGLPPQYVGKELSFQGVYCLKHDGDLILVDSLSRPNGIALSPDEKYLFVANSDKKKAAWFRYAIEESGEVGKRELFFDATEKAKEANGLPDGMEMHPAGYLFATGPGGVWVFDLGGKVLAKIHTGQLTSNCAFSADYRRLYLTADGDILRVDLK